MLYAFKLGRKLRGEEPYCPEKGGKGGADKSAKYAAEAQKYAADLQNQQFNTIMNNLKPLLLSQISISAVLKVYRLSKVRGRRLIITITPNNTRTLRGRLAIRIWQRQKQQVAWVLQRPVTSLQQSPQHLVSNGCQVR